MRIPKEYQPLAKRARSQGWSILPTGSGHLRWVNANGQSVFTPASPSVNGTGLIRIIRKLKANGLVT
jgi:hypothetical protein